MKTNYDTILSEAWRGMSAIFTALGDEHRQRILLLFEAGEKLTATQIATVVPLARTSLSHHLNCLRQAEVLLSEKVGKEVFFWINTSLLEGVMHQVLAYIKELNEESKDA